MTDSTWCFVQGNTRPYFAVQLLRQSDHTPINLTGATVRFFFRHADSATAAVSGSTMNVTDATNGKVEYRWAVGDLATPGNYIAELRISFADATIQSVIIEDVLVREKLA